MNDLVSICIPAYNAALFITETVKSWQKQSFTNFEIIIQDDCSIDDTYQIALKLAKIDKRIKVFKNAKNLGIGENWNECYKHTSGDYVVIFNADDIIFPNFLADSFFKFNSYPEIDMVIHNYARSFETKTDIINMERNQDGLINEYINIKNKPHRRFHWNFTLIKKKSLNILFNKYGLFYPTQVCDAMLWFEAYKKNLKAYYINKVAGIYSDHPNNNSKIKFGEFESTYLWMIPIYPEIFNLVHPKSFNNSIKLLSGYLYNCLKSNHKINFEVVKNIIKYRF